MILALDLLYLSNGYMVVDYKSLSFSIWHWH